MEPASVRILKWVYLVVFLVLGSFVALFSLVPSNVFQALDPSNLPAVADAPTLLVFRILVGFYLFLILLDAVALFNYRSTVAREVSSIASLAGFFLTGAACLFLIYVLGKADLLSTGSASLALLYLVIAVGLLLLDILTFFVDEENVLGLNFRKNQKDV